MRDLKPRFYILSAVRYSETDDTNRTRTKNLEASLVSHNLDFKKVAGYFEGNREDSFLILDKPHGWKAWDGDRKSTRLNSSHRSISYAVLCLKQKKC